MSTRRISWSVLHPFPGFVCSGDVQEARLGFWVKTPRGVSRFCDGCNSKQNWPSRDNSSSSGRRKWVIIGNCLWRLRRGNCLCIKQIRERSRDEWKGRTDVSKRERGGGGVGRDYCKARCAARKADYHIADIYGINRTY